MKLHLVLGGSHGIGFEYAKYHLELGHRVIIASRSRDNLNSVCAKLPGHATEIITRQVDVLNDRQIEDLLAENLPSAYETVFVGGPSPVGGAFNNTNSVGNKLLAVEDWRVSVETCLVYPYRVLHWAFAEHCPSTRVVLLSSSTIEEELDQTLFWSSAVTRRALDDVVASFLKCHGNETPIDVWYPKVVWTPLARSFAKSIPAAYPNEDPKERLCRLLGIVSIPSCRDYVEQMMSRNASYRVD